MAMTKSNILQRIAANVNSDATVPTGDELNLWSEFLEESNQEWAGSYDPQVLIKQTVLQVPTSGTSVALPTDFKEKFAGFIQINGVNVPEVKPEDAVFYSNQALWWGGNQNSGYYLNLRIALTSQSSLVVPYHSRPTSLPTLTSVSPIPDPHFLVNRVTEKILLQRGQGEYQEFQTKADLLLQRMVANEVTTDIQRDNTIKTPSDRTGFVFGDD